ncbi:MAG: glycosyltransferase, partial [Thioalkalivibrio sp.]|nr:glycosyltransferase [Thioalkalivibrio sp.]
MLYATLEAAGAHHVPHVPLEIGSFTADRPRADVLHLHWIYPLWRAGGTGGLRRRIRTALHTLATIRASGTRIVWTAHNLEPHDGYRRGEREAYGAVRGLAHLCLYHTKQARDAARELFGPTDADELVTPHGVLDGPPPRTDPFQTRAELGIGESDRLLLCFGQIRSNKGFDVALKALHMLGPEYRLLVAGQPLDRSARALVRRARRHRRAAVEEGLVEAPSLSSFLAAADTVLLPYRSVTSSGALLHALSCAHGVVATDLPFFREVCAPVPGAVEIVPPGDVERLALGVAHHLETPTSTRRTRLATLASHYAWPVCVAPFVRWLEQVDVKGNPGT